jgi:hypothetical protein
MTSRFVVAPSWNAAVATRRTSAAWSEASRAAVRVREMLAARVGVSAAEQK